MTDSPSIYDSAIGALRRIAESKDGINPWEGTVGNPFLVLVYPVAGAFLTILLSSIFCYRQKGRNQEILERLNEIEALYNQQEERMRDLEAVLQQEVGKINLQFHSLGADYLGLDVLPSTVSRRGPHH